MNARRLIEAAFPLKEVSLDSVHEKNVRHGHVSTLHIWPARRPLAASRAALLATLLPDAPEAGARRDLLRRMAGRAIGKFDRATGEAFGETSDGGVLHWGRESRTPSPGGAAPCNGTPADAEPFHPLLGFREEIKRAFGDRAPRVLDPFAGGGAIPLEAMRLGCEAVASDLNPVAWFLLRCTLHYPHLLAGKQRPLPDFARGDRAFLTAFFEARGIRRKRELRAALDAVVPSVDSSLGPWEREHLPHGAGRADFAWHLRAGESTRWAKRAGAWRGAIPPTRSSSRHRASATLRRGARRSPTRRGRGRC